VLAARRLCNEMLSGVASRFAEKPLPFPSTSEVFDTWRTHESDAHKPVVNACGAVADVPSMFGSLTAPGDPGRE